MDATIEQEQKKQRAAARRKLIRAKYRYEDAAQKLDAATEAAEEAGVKDLENLLWFY